MAGTFPQKPSPASYFVFFTQEVEFCRERKCIAIRDEGIIPSVRRLHVINRQLVGPGDMLPDVTKETTLVVTHNYAKDSCPSNTLHGRVRNTLNGFHLVWPLSPRHISRHRRLWWRDYREKAQTLGVCMMCASVCLEVRASQIAAYPNKWVKQLRKPFGDSLPSHVSDSAYCNSCMMLWVCVCVWMCVTVHDGWDGDLNNGFFHIQTWTRSSLI